MRHPFLPIASLLLASIASFSALSAPPQLDVSKKHNKIAFHATTKVMDAEGSFGSLFVTGDIKPQAIDQSRFTVTINTDSIDTGIEMRDTHLKSSDFFDVRTYPTATFATKAIKKTKGKDRYLVDGTLTIKKTKTRIQIPMTVTTQPGKGEKVQVRAQGAVTISRKKVGIDWEASLLQPSVGDDVKLSVDFAVLVDAPQAPAPAKVTQDQAADAPESDEGA